ncbi:MAG: lysophospholipid acyltransferase family protein [Pseudomonadota bacterium]
MNVTDIPKREKVVPKLFEEDASKYSGPHPLQLAAPARWLRKRLKHYAYTRWADVFTDVQVDGAEHLSSLSGPAIFVGNHTSHLDTILTQTALPAEVADQLFYGAAQDRWFVKGRKKKELHPWYQSFVLGTFPIMRGGGISALGYASEILDAGQHIFLFPEGTRAMDEELGAFKHGATILALRHQVPIVPLYLSGLRAIRPKGQKEPVPGRVGMDVLEPLRFASGTDVESATARLREAMNAAHRRYNVVPELTRSGLVKKADGEAA